MDLIRRFYAWAVTPVKVRQDASTDGHDGLRTDRGWAYRLPLVKRDLNDAAIAAAVKAGSMRNDDEEPRQRVTAAAGTGPKHTKAKEGR